MQIKTIVGIFADKFDEEVNKHLADGWELKKRGLVKSSQGALDKFYAELVKVVNPEPMDPMDAAELVSNACREIPVGDCQTDMCPLVNWCEALFPAGKAPSDWPGVQTR